MLHNQNALINAINTVIGIAIDDLYIKLSYKLVYKI